MTRHLPAVIVGRSWKLPRQAWAVLTAACGVRGPVTTREACRDGVNGELFSLHDDTCAVCSVIWDKAEEENLLALAWCISGKVSWNSTGAVVFAEQPSCVRCDGAWSQSRVDRMSTFAVVLRKS